MGNERYERLRDLNTFGPNGAYVARPRERTEHGPARVVVVTSVGYGPEIIADAERCAKLTHPNVIQVLDWGLNGDGAFVVLEYLEAVSVARLCNQAFLRGGVLDRALVGAIALSTLDALSFAHGDADGERRRETTTHGLLTPHNLFVTKDGQAKLRFLSYSSSKTATESTSLLGLRKECLGYVAPESLTQSLRWTPPPANQFSLASIVHELLAGKPLFRSPQSDLQSLVNIRDGTPENPVGEGIEPPALRAVLIKALAREPSERFESCAVFAEALANVWVPAARDWISDFVSTLLSEATIAEAYNFGGTMMDDKMFRGTYRR